MNGLYKRIQTWKAKGGVRHWLYLPLAFFTFLPVDFALQHAYESVSFFPAMNMSSLCFTLAWALFLAGICFVLPSFWRLTVFVFGVAFSILLTMTHTNMLHMYEKPFRFADLAFADEGFAFLEADYIQIDMLVVFGIVLTVLLAVLTVLLTPKQSRKRVKVCLALVLLSVGSITAQSMFYEHKHTEFIWNAYCNPYTIYEQFTDGKNALMITGLYHYTAKDLQMTYKDRGEEVILGEEELAQIASYRSGNHEESDKYGLYAGKNLMLIQLEAIDTWMLCPEYMPKLSALKEKSTVMTKHFTPAYIPAGTFNTEHMANTGLFPALGNVSSKVYVDNDYSYAMANQFLKAGYVANSFHGSEANVYQRGPIHEGWGYERYFAGSDMEMGEKFIMDSYLMNGYDAMIYGSPFFSFIITYSGHGPYGPEQPSFVAHEEEMLRVTKRDEGNYPNAVAHAMETDLFIGELVQALENDNLLDDTVLVFYADHYNYYMLNDELIMDIKNVDSRNMLQQTDFFIYHKGSKGQTIDKVTSTIDILPTIAELFALDDDDAIYMGSSVFSDEGGYVCFSDQTMYPAATETDEALDALRQEEMALKFKTSNLVLKSDYYAQ